MHILLLNWKDIEHPAAGGAEIVALELARRLVKEGHEVTWFAPRFVGAASAAEKDGVRIVRRGNILSVYFWAWRYYLAHQADIDLVIDSVNTLCWLTPLYTKRSIGIVYQLAEEVLYYHLPWPIAALAYWLEPFMYRLYRRTPIVCISESTRQDLIRIGLSPDYLHLMKLGLEEGRFAANSEKAASPLFVCVGRLVPMKRFDLAIRALKIVREQSPAARLVIIGRGPEASSLRALARECGVSEAFELFDNSTLLDNSGEDFKVMWLSRAWALVHPSVKEGWGLVVIEANACGTPAIVSNVCGLRDSIVANRTGLVVSANPSLAELAEAMLAIIQDRALAHRLESDAVEWAKHFRWEQTYFDFMRAIRTITENA